MTAVTVNSSVFYGVFIGITVCTVGICISAWCHAPSGKQGSEGLEGRAGRQEVPAMRHQVPGRRRGQRPRLCSECHVPATHAEVEQRPAAVLHRDGSIRRFVEVVSVFWCADHSGLVA